MRPAIPDNGPPLLVGRAGERELTHAQLGAALAGQGSLILLSGEAGIGKTALAEDACRAAAAAYPPALAAVLPGVLHETGKAVQQRIERDHQHLKGRLRPTRGCKTLAGARVLCRAHAFLRNLRGGFYDLGRAIGTATTPLLPVTVLAWAALTTELLAG